MGAPGTRADEARSGFTQPHQLDSGEELEEVFQAAAAYF